jgi:16S rRNA (guanine(966)-N(2))-methyltransferase RsmD
MLRIIGGAYKGRRLKLVRGPETRPMQDKVKGALFNILGELVADMVCLDGFAGTGSVGLEALSRGAARAVFVEESRTAAKVLWGNVVRCGAEEKAVVMVREFNRAVIQLAKEKVSFDLIFLDPPYRLLEERNPLKVVRKRRVLKPGGHLILRRHRKVRPVFKEFRLEREVALGDDVLAFFINEEEESGTA